MLYDEKARNDMKKFISAALVLSMTAAFAVMPASVGADESGTTQTVSYNYKYTSAAGYSDDDIHTREMEKLGRGLAAVKVDGGVYLSWRLLDSEDAIYGSAAENVKFNVYRGDEKIAEVTDSTNYVDASGTAASTYSVAPVTGDTEGEKCEAVKVNANSYFDITLTKPESETIISPSGETVGKFNFSPADCSTGDLDGDGEYEIIIKWTSSEHDVGSPGDGINSLSGTVRFAAYKLDGTKLWQNDINLGKNVYSSAHTVQFLVYDFNGDGKAEMMCQTSLGSTDASGAYVSHAAKTDTNIQAYTDEDNANAEFRSDWGPLTQGDEFLTVFNGETGEAIDTINFPTARVGNGESFGDTSGNRSNRFVSSVAYLDGKKPYAVYLRGYYFGRNGRQRTGISGTSFDGEKLSVDYQFDTEEGQPGYYDGAYQYVGNGNHNCTVADVDNDGKDEFITGALCMEVKDDNTFKPRWCTFMEHGDALHIGDYDPTIQGLEFFTVHEDSGPNAITGTPINFGMTVINSDTGDIIKHWESGDDNGRGVMANIGAGGFYQVTSANAGTYQSNGGDNFTAGNFGMSMNFRIFWDGDLYDELLDGVKLTNWNGQTMEREVLPTNTQFGAINGTKANPALQADLFGDWREEIVYPTTDGSKLRVFMTTTPTDYKMKTLMHDPVYRSGVAAEQTAYNQPPHIGFYLAEEMYEAEPISISVTSEPTKKVYTFGEKIDTTGLEVTAQYADGTSEVITAYGLSELDTTNAGEQEITVSYHGLTATFTVTVKTVSSITIVTPPTKTEYAQGSSLDLSGMVVEAEYSDGTKGTLKDSDYTVSGYNSGMPGTQTVTVSYAGASAQFTVTVAPADLSALNGTYSTSSTTSSNQRIDLGSFSDSFIIEHTLKINSMPASANARDKNNTSGFVLRFMSEGGTGSGWALMPNSDNTAADLIWKNGSNEARQLTQNAPIKVGEEYTVRYIFSGIAQGGGAVVNVIFYDSKGKEVVNVSDLDLRNLSFNEPHTNSPLTSVEIFNQARRGAESSVTIDNTQLLTCGITSVKDNLVKFYINTQEMLDSTVIYGVKYSNGNLVDLQELTLKNVGMGQSYLRFNPDKVLMWKKGTMEPIDCWVKAQ